MRKLVKYCRVCGYDVTTRDGFCGDCGENLVIPNVKKEYFDEFEDDNDETIKDDLDLEDDIK